MEKPLLEMKLKELATYIDHSISRYFSEIDFPSHDAAKNLVDSMKYSATNGGKRFRPVLSLLVAELFDLPKEKVISYAMAVEFIHTYSLIHDDLPCMDDDDERRGQPTNHKKFGEDIALIAGDGLLTEAFYLIATAYSDRPDISRRLAALLATKAGHRGMVGGQAIDMQAQSSGTDFDSLKLLHRLKTGALIQSAATGAAIIAEIDNKALEKISIFGEKLGLAFQIADDILDYDATNPEKGSYTAILGLEKTREELSKISDQAMSCLQDWPNRSQSLVALVEFNRSRNN